MADLITDKLNKQLAGMHVESRSDLRDMLVAQKTELIGELTQAIANDFNNIMMSITGHVELEMKKLPATERKGLEHILSNAARATALVQKLLTFSRKRTASPQPIHLNHLLVGISDLLTQLTAERAYVTFQLDPCDPVVAADPVEVEEAVLNLVINARDGMTSGGKIIITTRSVMLSDEMAAEVGRPGQYVLLSITHVSGSSVGAASQAVTLLDADARINLALSAVRGVVKSAGGLVRYSSEPGKGHSFNLYLPALAGDTVALLERNSPRSLPHARTILLVDDDDAVRIPAAEFLMIEGFKVLQAETGKEAIHVVAQSRSSLDVLVTDIVMPEMNGHELAQKLLELHPGLKVLYMSGDADRTRLTSAEGTSAKMTLRKPFRLDKLKDHIHELLGE